MTSASNGFIAADVGGTHTRVALARPVATGGAGGTCPVALLHVARYKCADWPGLAEIVADFIAKLPAAGHPDRPGAGVLACAGYVQDDRVVNVNLPWSVPLTAMRERLGMQHLAVINDFEALAHAVPHVADAGRRSLLDGRAGAAARADADSDSDADTHSGADRVGGLRAGPMVVMGPGTGLGCAAILPGRPHPQVLPTEAAHIALAPGTPRELDILRLLARTHPHVPVEHALSGPGLLKLYRAIAELRGEVPRFETPASVTAAALGAEPDAAPDPAALEALHTFCALLGSFAADLAVLYRASGGVLLAGGILPQIDAFLWESEFRARFLRKGVMVPFLERVPVHLVDHGNLGVLGAACWWVQQHGEAAR